MKRERPGKIHWQMTLWISPVILGILLLFALVDYRQQRQRLIGKRMQRMQQESELMTMAIQARRDPAEREEFIENYCETMPLHGRTGHGLLVIDPLGGTYRTGQAPTPETVRQMPAVRKLLEGEENSSAWRRTGNGPEALLSAHLYGNGANGSRAGLIYYSESLDDIRQLSYGLIAGRLAMLVAVFVLLVVAIWLFVKHRITRPLNSLLLHEWDVGGGDLARRNHPDPHNEISVVCEMFNVMLERIREHEEAEGIPPEKADSVEWFVRIRRRLRVCDQMLSRLRSRGNFAPTLQRQLENLQRTLDDLGERMDILSERMSLEDELADVFALRDQQGETPQSESQPGVARPAQSH